MAIFGIVVFLGLSVGRVFVRQAAFYREIEALESERERLLFENRSFERQLSFVSSEAFLEREARETFGQQRLGETAVYIDETPTATLEVSEEPVIVPSHMQQWIEFFFPN
ncbi:hypothetical protein A3C17_03870 [Candidatus Uhrbacteria bacterium RIFCSPHIGHO2_02_FULL_53_13]|uniref:Cell division protein FtsL n=1 Tax=Candidatus Uhrbacteria bacterium RIFCSPHIGHO2_02_FULL_53_13 TaxID=1802389 RepID=A0A1F7U0P9_9BACT|nr:MAG: hypothetical protein A3C17_03870 [Candidatus Uhrbacteria bacterium RIFCSPHIGHO2_02_FULL_53_13]